MPLDHEDHLALARRHVAEAERRIDEQVKRIKELRRDGHDSSAAAGQRLLVVFEESLRLMREHLAHEETEAKRTERR